jgi:hypothetical protein
MSQLGQADLISTAKIDPERTVGWGQSGIRRTAVSVVFAERRLLQP